MHVPQRDVTVESERHSIHEFGGVRDKSEQSDAKELFIDTRASEDDIDNVDQDLCVPK